jgi:hypothetical protein
MSRAWATGCDIVLDRDPPADPNEHPPGLNISQPRHAQRLDAVEAVEPSPAPG